MLREFEAKCSFLGGLYCLWLSESKVAEAVDHAPYTPLPKLNPKP